MRIKAGDPIARFLVVTLNGIDITNTCFDLFVSPFGFGWADCYKLNEMGRKFTMTVKGE